MSIFSSIIKNKKIWILSGIAIILIFLVVSFFVAYKTQAGDPVSKLLKHLYPAALVGGKPVSIEDTEEFISLANTMDNTATESQIYQTFLTRQKSEALLKKFGISIPSDVVSDELNFYEHGSQQMYSEFINTYFHGDERLFEQNVVYPEVVESLLRIKYNSDFSLNSGAYKKAQDALARINNGEKFEDVAKQVSDDKQSAQFGGDLGFYEHGQIIPELENQIAVAKAGEVSGILVTRNGYELVLPIETSTVDGVKKWHAKHILIETSGFEQWLTNQTNSISTTIIKKY